MFAMFFGAGNIVFPILSGRDASANYIYSFLGWAVSAILVVMMGFYCSMLYDCDNKKYMRFCDSKDNCWPNKISTVATHFLMLLINILNLLAASRAINVSFSGFRILSTTVSQHQTILCAIYTVVVALAAMKPDKIVDLMGKLFTPLKLAGISAVAFIAFVKAPQTHLPVTSEAGACFSTGFSLGYQTLDFISSFVVAGFILNFLKKSIREEGVATEDATENKAKLDKFILVSCAMCGVILAILYFVLFSIGAKYSPELAAIPQESLLTKIAQISIGGWASWFVAFVIFISCMPPAISLACVVTDYIYSSILRKKISRNIVLLAVSVVLFVLSMLSFQEIMNNMARLLGAICPALIVFVLYRLIKYYVGRPGKQQ